MTHDTTSILEIRGLTKHFSLSGGWPGRRGATVHALDDVSFSVRPGETLSIVGESGCGKSTLARTVLLLNRPTSGEVWFKGQRIDQLSLGQFRPRRRSMQVVYQDPYSSLNPRMTVGRIIAEPLVNFGMLSGSGEIRDRVAALLEQVRLPASAAGRYPHEFSGGQRQRIGIARALASEPDLIICDEAVSALDVSVKAQIINLFAEIQRERKLALLFISHDLAIVEHLTDKVAVLYLGKLVELGDAEAIFSSPSHPYTKALLSAVPVADPGRRKKRMILTGDVPSPLSPPSGCRFHTRCPLAFDRCKLEEPKLRTVTTGQQSACHLAE